MSAHIHHGPWINWSHGLIGGATITIGDREGGLLTAFIATFVTIVGAELWKIICYISHQVRSKHAPQDGLYHQQQVIFRTSPTPGGAAWLFLQQTWCWAGRARLSVLRTLPWAIFGAAYIGAIGLIAVFSSEISKSPGPSRLIVSDDCGQWVLNTSSPYRLEAYSAKITNDRYDRYTQFPIYFLLIFAALQLLLTPRLVTVAVTILYLVASFQCLPSRGPRTRMRLALSNPELASMAIPQHTRWFPNG